MHIEGGCHCGQIAYEAEVDPSLVNICHCTDCQALSGSPYRVTLRVPADQFLLRQGQPAIYVRIADSGAKLAQAFCAQCGTPIYGYAPDSPTTYGLRWGSVKQRAQLPPRRQIWCDSAAPWAMNVGELPSVARQS
jgi:hypothetical protein